VVGDGLPNRLAGLPVAGSPDRRIPGYTGGH